MGSRLHPCCLNQPPESLQEVNTPTRQPARQIQDVLLTPQATYTLGEPGDEIRPIYPSSSRAPEQTSLSEDTIQLRAPDPLKKAVQTDSTRSNTQEQGGVVQYVPTKNENDDWMITSNTWTGAEKSDGESDKDHKDRQLTNDAVIMYQTMFADPNNLPSGITITPKQKQRTLAKQEFMRRLHLAMAVGGVKMSKEDNPVSSDGLTDYTFPLASVLSHGQRHLFETKGDSTNLGERLFNYLLSGSEEGKTSIVNRRAFASHGTKIHSSGQIEELKYPFVKQFQGLFTGKHKGVNIPLGGIGNLDFNKNIIGPCGKPINPTSKQFLKGKQHGHIYINKHQRGNKMALMFGLEGAAPLKTNMFNVEHNASSGTEDQTKKISATGGQKLSKLLGEKAPAEYGGKRTIVDENKLKEIMKVEEAIAGLPIAQQQQLFKELLLNPPTQSMHILEKYIGKKSEVRSEEQSEPSV